MKMKVLIKILLGAVMLAPSLAWSDAEKSKIFLLANQSTDSTSVTVVEMNTALDEKLIKFFACSAA